MEIKNVERNTSREASNSKSKNNKSWIWNKICCHLWKHFDGEKAMIVLNNFDIGKTADEKANKSEN